MNDVKKELDKIAKKSKVDKDYMKKLEKAILKERRDLEYMPMHEIKFMLDRGLADLFDFIPSMAEQKKYIFDNQVQLVLSGIKLEDIEFSIPKGCEKAYNLHDKVSDEFIEFYEYLRIHGDDRELYY